MGKGYNQEFAVETANTKPSCVFAFPYHTANAWLSVVCHLYSDSRLKAGIFLYHTEFHQSILPPRLWALRRHVQVSLVQTAVIRIDRNLFITVSWGVFSRVRLRELWPSSPSASKAPSPSIPSAHNAKSPNRSQPRALKVKIVTWNMHDSLPKVPEDTTVVWVFIHKACLSGRS